MALVQIVLPIEFPLYNLQSGRTHRAQTEYGETHGLPDDFFGDPEASEPQSAQHEILTGMVAEQGLAADLRQKSQKNPLVLTYDGFVIDGNRRLAALRENERDVENVLAVVLPEDATASEVYETELELQMSRETKAEYNWIDSALHVRYGVERLYSDRGGEAAIHSVAQRMNVDDRDVEGVLAQLALVDLYLDWLGAPGMYHRIPSGERSQSRQAFNELADREARQNVRRLPERQRRSMRLACFAVIQQQGDYKDIRRVADSIRERPFEVVVRTRDRIDDDLRRLLDSPIETQEQDQDDPGDLLTQLAGAEDSGPEEQGAELLNVLIDPSVASRVADPIVEVAREIDDEQREAQQHEEPVKQVEKAVRLLRSVVLTGETRRLTEIGSALQALIVEVDRVSDQLQGLRGDLEEDAGS